MTANAVQKDILLSIVIVNWNTSAILQRCITSIAEVLTDVSHEVIVVDNHSEDGSADAVASNHPHVELIRNEVNRGFSGGVNDGLRRGSGEYFLVLNPDIQLLLGVIETLLKDFQNDVLLGMVTPRLLNEDGSDQSGYVRKYPTIPYVFFFETILAPWSRKNDSLRSVYLQESFHPVGLTVIEQIPGAFMMFRRKVYTETHGMKEHYLLFFEDVDFSYRIRKAGGKLCLNASVSAVHMGGKSFQTEDNYWMFGRFAVSLVQFFVDHRSAVHSLCVMTILTGNSIAVILMRQFQRIIQGGNLPRGSAFSLKKHQFFLKLFYHAFIVQHPIKLHETR